LKLEETKYHTLAREIREAFAKEHFSPTGTMSSDAQTAYALAIDFGLLRSIDPARIAHAAERLTALVRENNYCIGTGFVGTPLMCDALTTTGNLDTAYQLLMQQKCPSWLYPVTMGATTIWERWDSLLPNGSVNPGDMTSFNHYALGAVADWIHRTIGGIAPATPGYKCIKIAPRPGGGLTHASASHLTPYGMVKCEWKIEDGHIEVKAVVPPNTTANVYLPGKEKETIEVGSGQHSWRLPFRS